MNLLVATEARFRRNSDGIACSDTGGRGYSFWQRYLDVFDGVTVIGRLSSREGPAVAPVEGPGVSFFPLPGYVGPAQYLGTLGTLKRRVRQACSDQLAFIARVPGAIGSLVLDELEKKSWPYGLEVVGDPYDVFSPGAIRHPLRPLFRWWFSRRLRRQCAGACATAYVTEQALQRRYPPAPGAFSTSYSSIELQDIDFVSQPRTFPDGACKLTLITVGMLRHLYKGPDVLIDALGICVGNGLDLRLIIVGEGKHRSELESRVATLGLAERVHFCGLLPAGDAVRAMLDEAHVFVLASRQEGLPRAMIEAMARALPCIGSTAGGIPELLPPEDLVPPGDAVALARRIRQVLSDRHAMARMSARNLEKAKQYREEVLRERRIAFYRHIREATEACHR